MTNAKSQFTSEKDWSDQIIDMAKLFRWRSYHTFDSRKSSAGFPDLCLVRRGRLVFAELKTDRPGSELSDHQAAWIAELQMVADVSPSVEVYLWRPSQIDDVRAVLR